MRPLSTVAALALALIAAGCLENEEEIEVRADGSIHVVTTSSGDAPDLAGGYPIALSGPWTPVGADTLTWLRRLGPDTGSAQVIERAEDADWAAWFGIDPAEDKLELSATADFASVAEWPRFHAPASDPYRTAYSERSASLSVDDKGDRIVYTFERVYHARPMRGFDVKGRLEDAFPDEIEAKLDEQAPLSADELATVASIVRREHRTLFASLAGAALELVYVRGSASLAPAAADGARAALEDVADELFSTAAVGDLWARIRVWESDAEPQGPHPLEELEVAMRDRLRAALARSLAADRVPEDTGNELLFGLEWVLTRYDHALDLDDEKFAVAVRMPGTIVAGNFDERVDGAARWSFEADALDDRDVVMRAVSVLPK